MKILLGFIEDGRSGGVDKYILHFLDAVCEDGVQVDLLTNRIDERLEKELGMYHSRLFAIASLRRPLKQFLEVRRLIQREGYEAVYLNISTAMDLVAALAAKSLKVPRRMLHSHSGGTDCESGGKRLAFHLLQRICRLFLYRLGNEYYACSKAAGYWMYPRKIVESGRFEIIYNAVDKEKFCYRPKVREKVRKTLSLCGKLAIGHVGNFCYQKNHEFLLRVFEEVHKRRKDTALILVGKGVRFDEIRRRVKDADLEECVHFLGWRGDVDELFQAMDVFLLPSHFEGLPTVGIEAQCTGLPCVMSDSITQEAAITDRCAFLSLKESPGYWAQRILDLANVKRGEARFLEGAHHYDLEEQKRRLKEMIGNEGR